MLSSVVFSPSLLNGQDDTLLQKVKSASVIPGEVQLKSITAIYIEIPDENGYLEFDVQDQDEVKKLLKAVSQTYKGLPKNKGLDKVENEWELIAEDNPNSGVYKTVIDPEVGIEYWRTCACGYCCWN